MLPVDILMRAIALLLAGIPALSWGLSSDRDQPIHIESDTANLEEHGVSTFIGNVYVTQGTLKLRGHTMTVHNREDQVDKIILLGNPATFSQRPDGKDEDMHGESQRMEYHAADERIILLDSAHVWQPDGKEMRSEKIIYNYRNNTVNAGDSSTGDRVHITLPPKSRETGEAGASTAVQEPEPREPRTTGESPEPPAPQATPEPQSSPQPDEPQEAASQ